MLPLLALLAALGVYAMSKKSSEPSVINVSPGDLYRIRVSVPAADRSQIEVMYRAAMSQVGQIGSIIWDGDIMVVQVQYLMPSTITLGTMRAGTTTINVMSAELLYRGAVPVVLPAPVMTPQAAATVGAVVSRALRSGDPVEIIGAAAFAEKCGAPRLAQKLVQKAATGYRVRA
jgi:hypothetical protein